MSTATVTLQMNPFPGLRPFREEEEYLFFGRESQVDAMVNKLAATHFLAVVGTSGSGKSSLVNCGLRPALHRGLLAQDGVLFHRYEAGSVPLAEIVETTLRMSKLGLIDIYEQARLGEEVNLLVVVDQFEELFRYRQLGAAQQGQVSSISEDAIAFVNLLLEVREQATYPIYAVLTMRSDFLGDCAQFPGLAEAINAGQYLVPRLTRDERRAAISGPIGVGGAEIAPVLLTRLVNDVGDNPDQLSILQHALNRTWAHWQRADGGTGPLDLTHYDAIGTMAHALDQHAETAYAELGTARQRQICEKLFKALTDKATGPSRGTTSDHPRHVMRPD
jgi:ABC-type dipeptide/oligopeptide/nickel transport system ATPase component